MRRRTFVAGLAGATAVWPHRAHAQQINRIRRIVCLVTGSPDSHGAFVTALRQRLGEMGYVEGRDLAFDVRWAHGHVERLSALAEQLAVRAPDVIVTATSADAVAAKRAMPKIPIVSATLVDPIGVRLIESLARPGGNVTGISLVSFETLLGKQLDAAREVIAGVRKVGVLINTPNPAALFQRDSAQAVAPRFGMELIPIEVRSPEDLEPAVDTLVREGSEIVLLLADALLITERRRIAALTLAARLPTVSGLRDMTEAGGLLSYGTNLIENWRRAAYFVDRILKGAKPADLPVEQPTEYRLVINLKTAQALGLTIPPALLARADEVIE